MKLKELDVLLTGSLETVGKYIEELRDTIYIFNIFIKYQDDNTALISVDASNKHHDLVWKFIYSTLSDLEDIEWVDYHRYDIDEDLYYFGVEFK